LSGKSFTLSINDLLDQLVPHANQHEIHRELGQTPHEAHQQALAQNRSVIRPAPKCPWWPFVWSQQTSVRVGDDGQDLNPIEHLWGALKTRLRKDLPTADNPFLFIANMCQCYC